MVGSSFTFNEGILKEEVRKYLTLRGQQACMYARDLLKSEAQRAIEKFYENYFPKIYHRTESVKDHSVQPFYRQYGSVIVGGVFLNGYRLNNGDIDPVVSSEKRIAAMNSAWNYGEHGSYLINPGIRMNPTPHDLMERFWTRQKKQECISHGASIAKTANYRLLYFK